MLYRYLFVAVCSLWSLCGFAQTVTQCPPNIGFETGNFSNWETYIGQISLTRDSTRTVFPRPAVVTVTRTPPAVGQHTLIPRGSGSDEYGHFSLNSPNGSEYVVRLGNGINGRGAERISYTLQVPSNVTDYSVIFNYAVVFQNPGHDDDEQPRFTARVLDLTTGTSTSCGSFEFVAQGGIPGFINSDVPFVTTGPNNTTREAYDVLYKPWSPVFVNLSEYIGHTIRLEFTTNDCSRGGHFGYAYIDFNENCSVPITGNVTCPENDSLVVRTLPGFNSYRWYNADTDETLSTADSVVLKPILPIGTRIAVDLVPYPGLGCSQTLYTTVQRMAMTIIDPPPACEFVDLTDISLKLGNSNDISYSYWLDSAATQPIPDPRRIRISGRYYIKGTSTSGCVLVRPVQATIIVVPPVRVHTPPVATHPETVDITRSFDINEEFTYTFWRNAAATIPLPDPTRVGRRGTYYVRTVSPEGCVGISPIDVLIRIPDIVVPNAFTPNNDGVNDVFTVLVNENVKVKQFRIHNRWGDVVFKTSDLDNFWTGFRDNSEVPAGVYYWVLDGILDNKKYLRSGWVTLLR